MTKKQIILKRCSTHKKVRIFGKWKSEDDEHYGPRLKECRDMIEFEEAECDECQVEK